jgi:hypothetical protein
MAYYAGGFKKFFAVVDGHEGEKYDEIAKNKKNVFDSPDNFHYLAFKGSDIYLVEMIRN